MEWRMAAGSSAAPIAGARLSISTISASCKTAGAVGGEGAYLKRAISIFDGDRQIVGAATFRQFEQDGMILARHQVFQRMMEAPPCGEHMLEGAALVGGRASMPRGTV